MIDDKTRATIIREGEQLIIVVDKSSELLDFVYQEDGHLALKDIVIKGGACPKDIFYISESDKHEKYQSFNRLVREKMDKLTVFKSGEKTHNLFKGMR